MSPFFLVGRRKAQNSRRALSCIAGERIYRAGADGLAGRLNSGVIRLFTDLRFETISRIIKMLERTQGLLPVRVDDVYATCSFQRNLAAAT